MSMVDRLQDEKHQKILASLKTLPENDQCANCTEKNPRFVCADFDIFICGNCATIHREFGHRTKSIALSTFTKDEIQSLKMGGNKFAREKWLATWTRSDYFTPNTTDTSKIREFIRLRYIERKWVASGSRALVPSSSQQQQPQQPQQQRPTQQPQLEYHPQQHEQQKPAASLQATTPLQLEYTQPQYQYQASQAQYQQYQPSLLLQDQQRLQAMEQQRQQQLLEQQRQQQLQEQQQLLEQQRQQQLLEQQRQHQLLQQQRQQQYLQEQQRQQQLLEQQRQQQLLEQQRQQELQRQQQLLEQQRQQELQRQQQLMQQQLLEQQRQQQLLEQQRQQQVLEQQRQMQLEQQRQQQLGEQQRQQQLFEQQKQQQMFEQQRQQHLLQAELSQRLAAQNQVQVYNPQEAAYAQMQAQTQTPSSQWLVVQNNETDPNKQYSTYGHQLNQQLSQLQISAPPPVPQAPQPAYVPQPVPAQLSTHVGAPLLDTAGFESGNVLDFDEDQTLAWERTGPNRSQFLNDAELAKQLQEEEDRQRARRAAEIAAITQAQAQHQPMSSKPSDLSKDKSRRHRHSHRHKDTKESEDTRKDRDYSGRRDRDHDNRPSSRKITPKNSPTMSRRAPNSKPPVQTQEIHDGATCTTLAVREIVDPSTTCSACGFKGGDPETLKRHRVSDCVFRVVGCPYCSKTVKQIQHKEHMEICSTRKHHCQHCGVALLGSDLLVHLRSVHGVVNQPGPAIGVW